MGMRRFANLWLGIAACVAACGCGRGKTPGGECDFRLKWPKDRQCIYRVEVRQRIETRIPGKPGSVLDEVAQTVEAAASVSTNADGAGSVELTLISATVEFTGSESGRQTRKWRRDLKGVAGARIVYRLEPSGRPAGADGVADFMKQVIADGPLASKTLAQVFNEDFLARMRIAGWEYLPGGAAGQGKTWKLDRELLFPDIGFVRMRGKYAFPGWESREGRPVARISWQGTVAEGPARPVDDAALVKSVVKSGEAAGGAWFSPALGLVSAWFEEVKLTAVADLPGLSGEKAVQVTQDARFRISVMVAEALDTKQGSGRLLADKKVRVGKTAAAGRDGAGGAPRPDAGRKQTGAGRRTPGKEGAK